MKNLNKVKNVFLVLGLSLMALGCGKNDSNNNSGGGGAVAVTPGVCPAGQVWITQANACVAQQGCQVGQGWYNNVCTQGVNQGGINGYPYQGNGYPYQGGYGQGGYGYQGGYGQGGYGYNQGGYNTQYYSPYQNNCYYKQKGIFYYYVCGY